MADKATEEKEEEKQEVATGELYSFTLLLVKL